MSLFEAEIFKSKKAECFFIIESLRCLFLAEPFPDSQKRILKTLDIEWMIPAVKRNGVGGFFVKALQKFDLLAILPKETQARLIRELDRCAKRFEEMAADFEYVQSVSTKHNIPMLPFKGAVLTALIYSELPYRIMSDVDIIIREEDEPRLHEIFFNEGFSLKRYQVPNRWQTEIIQRNYTSHFFKDTGRHSLVRDNLDIDIHTELKYHAGQAPVLLDMKSVWKRSSGKEGSQLQHLSIDDHAMVILLHAADLYYPKLIQLLDLALLMRHGSLVPERIQKLFDEGWSTDAKKLLRQVVCAADEWLRPGRELFSFSEETENIFYLFLSGQTNIFCPVKTLPNKKIHIMEYLKMINLWSDKVKFLAGYFLPNPLYYKNTSIAGSYIKHWGHLVAKVFKAVLGQLN